jgi:hypothetical protein
MVTLEEVKAVVHGQQQIVVAPGMDGVLRRAQ